jgi:hypothetical protein
MIILYNYVLFFNLDRNIESCLKYSEYGINSHRIILLPNSTSVCRGLQVVLSTETKGPGREADHSLPCSAEVKNAWSYTSTRHYVFMA